MPNRELHALLLRRTQTARQGRPSDSAAGIDRIGWHQFPPRQEKNQLPRPGVPRTSPESVSKECSR